MLRSLLIYCFILFLTVTIYSKVAYWGKLPDKPTYVLVLQLSPQEAAKIRKSLKFRLKPGRVIKFENPSLVR